MACEQTFDQKKTEKTDSSGDSTPAKGADTNPHCVQTSKHQSNFLLNPPSFESNRIFNTNFVYAQIPPLWNHPSKVPRLQWDGPAIERTETWGKNPSGKLLCSFNVVFSDFLVTFSDLKKRLTGSCLTSAAAKHVIRKESFCQGWGNNRPDLCPKRTVTLEANILGQFSSVTSTFSFKRHSRFFKEKKLQLMQLFLKFQAVLVNHKDNGIGK